MKDKQSAQISRSLSSSWTSGMECDSAITIEIAEHNSFNAMRQCTQASLASRFGTWARKFPTWSQPTKPYKIAQRDLKETLDRNKFPISLCFRKMNITRTGWLVLSAAASSDEASCFAFSRQTECRDSSVTVSYSNWFARDPRDACDNEAVPL